MTGPTTPAPQPEEVSGPRSGDLVSGAQAQVRLVVRVALQVQKRRTQVRFMRPLGVR